jgi:fatty-acyl-CoA synthase
VPSAGAEPDPDELIALCAGQLARFKVPRHVVFVTAEELPLTATGRVQKFKLAELAKQRLQQAAERLGTPQAAVMSTSQGATQHVHTS